MKKLVYDNSYGLGEFIDRNVPFGSRRLMVHPNVWTDLFHEKHKMLGAKVEERMGFAAFVFPSMGRFIVVWADPILKQDDILVLEPTDYPEFS